jgi:hypothetical protein
MGTSDKQRGCQWSRKVLGLRTWKGPCHWRTWGEVLVSQQLGEDDPNQEVKVEGGPEVGRSPEEGNCFEWMDSLPQGLPQMIHTPLTPLPC